MSLPSEITPIEDLKLYDLLAEAGVDVSDWANYKRGYHWRKANSKYCYRWAFLQPGKVAVLNLWLARMAERDGSVTYLLDSKSRIAEFASGQKTAVLRHRAAQMDEISRSAYVDRLPVRVVVNAGRIREASDIDTRPSRVERRLLDPVPWAITKYDPDAETFTVVRGVQPLSLVDQVVLRRGEINPSDRTPFSGHRYARDRAIRDEALKRAKGHCEYCGAAGFPHFNGGNYLETHHVIPRGEGGLDHESNVAALCPNHHREAHHGASRSAIRDSLTELLNKIHAASGLAHPI